MEVTGLCHSVQGTAKMLGEWIGAREEDMTYTCAGVNRQAFYLDLRLAREKTWVDELNRWIAQEPVDTQRSGEYAANIFNARFGGGKLFKFNGNVLNRYQIDNLPLNSCVEVPGPASRYGMEAIHVGPLLSIIYANLILKTFNYPIATSDAFNHISRQQTYVFAQAIYHVRKRVEHFISGVYGGIDRSRIFSGQRSELVARIFF